MSRWRRSVDELAARRRQHECERAQDALSRVTSCFQQLVALVGSSADGSFLRDELDETRAVAHRICSGNTCLWFTCPSHLCVSRCLTCSPDSHCSISLMCLQGCPAGCCACFQTLTLPPQVCRTGRFWSVCGFSSCQHWSTSCMTCVRPVT